MDFCSEFPGTGRFQWGFVPDFRGWVNSCEVFSRFPGMNRLVWGFVPDFRGWSASCGEVLSGFPGVARILWIIYGFSGMGHSFWGVFQISGDGALLVRVCTTISGYATISFGFQLYAANAKCISVVRSKLSLGFQWYATKFHLNFSGTQQISFEF